MSSNPNCVTVLLYQITRESIKCLAHIGVWGVTQKIFFLPDAKFNLVKDRGISCVFQLSEKYVHNYLVLQVDRMLAIYEQR